MDPDRSIATFALALLIVLIGLNIGLLGIQLQWWRKGSLSALLERLVGRGSGSDGHAGPGRPKPSGHASNGNGDRSHSRAGTSALSAADLDPEDQRIVHKAMAFSRKVVCDVMVPRLDMICVPADAPLRDILTTAGRSGHSRIPVFDCDIDHIVGFVHAKDLLKLASEPSWELTAREIMRHILAVPENKAIDD